MRSNEHNMHSKWLELHMARSWLEQINEEELQTDYPISISALQSDSYKYPLLKAVGTIEEN
jgi:hypothetical protein